MRLLFSALLILAAAASFAADGPPPDEQASGPGGVGGTVGHGINWGLDQVPFVGGVVKGLNNLGRGVIDGVRGRGGKREAAEQRQMLWQLCVANPETHGAACAKAFPEFKVFFENSGASGSSSRASPPLEDAPTSLIPPAGLGLSNELVAGTQRKQGYRDEPYDDGSGALHVFFGHNLSANRLLFADLVKYRRQAMRVVGADCWHGLAPARQDVITQLAYDNGEAGLRRWDDFIPALCDGQYELAAVELADSQWMLDAGAEGLVLAAILRRGDYG